MPTVEATMPTASQLGPYQIARYHDKDGSGLYWFILGRMGDDNNESNFIIDAFSREPIAPKWMRQQQAMMNTKVALG